ncbi:MAG: hypothetical protein Q8P62_00500 [Candidatus Peregrinibacteria bacterium]|nr:hypothetical protein [Candidatus Peregrinibacteria bacterium]
MKTSIDPDLDRYKFNDPLIIKTTIKNFSFFPIYSRKSFIYIEGVDSPDEPSGLASYDDLRDKILPFHSKTYNQKINLVDKSSWEPLAGISEDERNIIVKSGQNTLVIESQKTIKKSLYIIPCDIELTKKLTKQIEALEISQPNIDKEKILENIPSYTPSDLTLTKNNPETGLKYISNELLIIPNENYNQDILISQIYAVGADISSYEKDVPIFKIILPKNATYEQFSATKSALEKSKQIEVIIVNTVMDTF